MIKNVLVSIIVIIILCALMISITGCISQQGETVAEGHRRHLRKLRIESKQMAEDMDAVMMTDQPSKLGELRSP